MSKIFGSDDLQNKYVLVLNLLAELQTEMLAELKSCVASGEAQHAGSSGIILGGVTSALECLKLVGPGNDESNQNSDVQGSASSAGQRGSIGEA